MMLRLSIVFLAVLSLSRGAEAQKYASEKGYIRFYSKAAIEDITATNQKVTALFDAGNGSIAFVVPINQFVFAKALMQEHFNEKYLESDRYPKSTFQGQVVGFDTELVAEQSVKAQGKLTIHGVTREVTVPGVIRRVDKGLQMTSTFIVELKDYKISIPRLMWQNIAERVEVTLDLTFRAADE